MATDPVSGSLTGQTRRKAIRGVPKGFPINMPEPFIATGAESRIIDRKRKQSLDFSLSQPPSHTPSDRLYEPDYNIMSESVVRLNGANFEKFTRGKEKALVVFYKHFQCQHIDFESDFSSIAEGSTNPKHGFGAVDCCSDRDLCARENICCTPVLKLYSNGYELGSIMSAAKLNATQMNMMIKMTPVLKKPKTHPEPNLGSCWAIFRKQTSTIS